MCAPLATTTEHTIYILQRGRGGGTEKGEEDEEGGEGDAEGEEKREEVSMKCHETTAHAAQLERSGFAARVRPVSNVRVFQGVRHGILKGFATLPLKKGLTGFGHDVA